MTNLRDVERGQAGRDPLAVPLSVDGSEVLTFDVGEKHGRGWAAYHSPLVADVGVAVELRFGPESATQDAPLDIRELHFITSSERGGSAFSSALMRTIPIARIVAAVNRPAIRQELLPYMPPWSYVQSGREGSPLVSWRFPPEKPAKLARPKLRIPRSDGRRKPDSFYLAAAMAYLDQATISNRAAQDLALANDVPVTTVHRWLKEARNRGLLSLPHSGQEGKS